MYVKQDYHNNHHHNNNHNHNGHHHSSNHHSHNNHHNYNNNNNNNYDYDDRYSEDHHHHHHHSTEVSDSDTSDDEDNTCPLCCEEFDLFDRGFKPCACGYQICQFCYKNIRENPELNGKCPACRRTYDEKLAEYQTITPEEWKQYQIKKDAKEKRRKQREREMRKEVMVSGNGLVGTNSNNNNNNNSNNSNSNSNNNNNIGSTTAAALNSIGSGNAAAAAAALNGIFGGLGMGKDGSGSYRKHLAGVRVIQKNLVYVIGYQSNSTIDELEKMLSSDDYFGRYGKIKKIVINKRFSNGPIGSGASGHSSNSSGGATSGAPSLGIYVTYVRKDDAAKCIAAVDGSVNDDGKYLRAAYGTTKYCSSYLKGQTCPNPNCMFLHEPGEEADGFYNGKNSEASHLHAVAGSQVQAVVGALNGKISRELSPMLLHAKLNGGNFAVGSLLSGSPLNSSNLQHSQNGGNPVGNTLHEEDHSIPALPATASWGSGLNKSSPRVGGAKLVLDVSSSLASSAVSSSSSPGSTAGSASPTVNTPSTASTTASATSTTTTTTTATTTTTTTTTATPSPSTTPTPVPVVTKKEEIMTPKRALPLAPMTSRLIEGILSNMEDRFGERVSKGKKNSIRIKPVSEYGVKFDSSLFTSEELEEIEGLPTFFTVFDRFPNDSEGYSNYCYDLSDDLRHYSDLIEKRGMDFGVRSRAVFSLRETFGEEGNRDDADNDENNNNNNSHELIQVINGNTILEGLNQPTSGNLGNQLNQANLNVNMNVNTSMSSPRSSQMAHQGTPPPGLNSEYGHGQMNGSGGHGSGSNSQELLARLMNGGRSR